MGTCRQAPALRHYAPGAPSSSDPARASPGLGVCARGVPNGAETPGSSALAAAAGAPARCVAAAAPAAGVPAGCSGPAGAAAAGVSLGRLKKLCRDTNRTQCTVLAHATGTIPHTVNNKATAVEQQCFINHSSSVGAGACKVCGLTSMMFWLFLSPCVEWKPFLVAAASSLARRLAASSWARLACVQQQHGRPQHSIAV